MGIELTKEKLALTREATFLFFGAGVTAYVALNSFTDFSRKSIFLGVLAFFVLCEAYCAKYYIKALRELKELDREE